VNEAAKAKTIVELEWKIDWLKEQVAIRDRMIDQNEVLFNAVKAYCEGTGGAECQKLHDQLIATYLKYKENGGFL
jgi:hypothetical protein